MKAIFMTELGGKLVEIDRRDIKPSPIYYCAVREPIQYRAISEAEMTQTTLAIKREKWSAHSMPNHPDGFAVFLLDSIE